MGTIQGFWKEAFFPVIEGVRADLVFLAPSIEGKTAFLLLANAGFPFESLLGRKRL